MIRHLARPRLLMPSRHRIPERISRCRQRPAMLAAAMTCAGLAACTSTAVRETPELRVESRDAASAEGRLELASRLRARILADLVSLRPEPGRSADGRSIRIIEARRESWHEAIVGSADEDERIIRLRADATDVDMVLSHELTHLLLGTGWSALPALVEEGLADYLGAQALDALPRIRAERGEGLMRAYGGLRLNVSWRLPGANQAPLLATTVLEWDAPRLPGALPGAAGLVDIGRESFEPQGFDPLWSPIYYGAGFVLVERIVEQAGLPHLYRACVETSDAGVERVPALRLFELADAPAGPADPDLSTLVSWLRDSWDEDTQRAWLAWRAVPLAPALARATGWNERAAAQATSEERHAALSSWQMRISVTWEGLPADSATAVSLTDVPVLLARLMAQPISPTGSSTRPNGPAPSHQNQSGNPLRFAH